MMNSNKKWLVLITLLVLFNGQKVFAIGGPSAKYHYFNLPDGGIIICGIDTKTRTTTIVSTVTTRYTDRGGVSFTKGIVQDVKGDINIPAEVEVHYRDDLYGEKKYVGRFTLVALAGGAFQGCSELTSVTLPLTVEQIADNAFSGCSKLETVNLPSTIKQISLSCFSGCNHLKAVNIASGVGVSYNSFDGILCQKSHVIFCPKDYQGTVHIPSTMRTVDKETFKEHNGITEVIIENGVQKIDEAAFKNCTLLGRVVIPSSVNTIRSESFCGCTTLETVNLGEGLAELWSRAFADCPSLKEIALPSGVSYIGPGAFANCFGLEKVSFANGVKRIGDEAFSFCSSLREIRLPTSIESIGEKSFMGCDALEKVVLNPQIKQLARYAFYGCSNLTSINVPKQAKVYEDTFMECYKLKRP